MTLPAEILVFEFLETAITSVEPSHPIAGLELHDTVFQKIRTNRGVRISDCSSAFSPNSLDETEYNAEITLAIYSKVVGRDKTERQDALQDVFILQREITKLFREDSSLGGRVCDSVLLAGSRGYDVLDGEPYAVANVPLILNPRGAAYTTG